MAETRRRAPQNMSRRQRRAGGVRSYTVPSSAPASATLPSRRSYMAEPAPFDYSTEYYYVRKDLLRILLWASILIGAIVVLSFLPFF